MSSLYEKRSRATNGQIPKFVPPCKPIGLKPVVETAGATAGGIKQISLTTKPITTGLTPAVLSTPSLLSTPPPQSIAAATSSSTVDIGTNQNIINNSSRTVLLSTPSSSPSSSFSSKLLLGGFQPDQNGRKRATSFVAGEENYRNYNTVSASAAAAGHIDGVGKRKRSIEAVKGDKGSVKKRKKETTIEEKSSKEQKVLPLLLRKTLDNNSTSSNCRSSIESTGATNIKNNGKILPLVQAKSSAFKSSTTGKLESDHLNEVKLLGSFPSSSINEKHIGDVSAERMRKPNEEHKSNIEKAVAASAQQKQHLQERGLEALNECIRRRISTSTSAASSAEAQNKHLSAIITLLSPDSNEHRNKNNNKISPNSSGLCNILDQHQLINQIQQKMSSLKNHDNQEQTNQLLSIQSINAVLNSRTSFSALNGEESTFIPAAVTPEATNNEAKAAAASVENRKSVIDLTEEDQNGSIIVTSLSSSSTETI